MKTIAQQLNVAEFPFEIKDKNGNVIYYEKINGNWSKWEYDENNNKIYYEDSFGYFVDYTSKSTIKLRLQQIADEFGIDVKDLKIKK